jgi:hypothetical protein
LRKEYRVQTKQASVRFALTPLRITWRVHGRTPALVGANQSRSYSIPKPGKDGPEIPSTSTSFLCFCCSVIIAHKDEDPVTKTMEDFSGYPIDEPHSFFQKSFTLLSVDTESLQKEVLGLAFTGFLFEESGCDNNNVCVY